MHASHLHKRASRQLTPGRKRQADDRAAHRPCSRPAGNQPDHRLACPGAPSAGSAALGASPDWSLVCVASPIWSLLCAAQLQGCAGAQRPPHHHHRMRANHRRIKKLPGFSSFARASLAARTIARPIVAGRLVFQWASMCEQCFGPVSLPIFYAHVVATTFTTDCSETLTTTWTYKKTKTLI